MRDAAPAAVQPTMSPHPTLRVLAVLLAAAWAGWASTPALAGALLFGVVAHAAGGAGALSHWLRLVRRASILLIAVWLSNLWLTPGEALWPASAWSPSVSGWDLALQRSLLLLVMITAVSCLLVTTPVPVLATAVVALLRPVVSLGVDAERVARRVAWTLALLPATEARLRNREEVRDPTARVAALVREVEARALPPEGPLPAVAWRAADAAWAAGGVLLIGLAWSRAA